MMISFILVMFILVFGSFVEGFFPSSWCSISSRGVTTIYMGRAAAVRANTKARTDLAKSKNNCYYAKKIQVAIKNGGPDPNINRDLGTVLADARSANVPNDVIKRNLDKGSSADAADFKESTFEFYGHGGIGMIVNILTDNSNRATNDVNLVAKKNNLRSASPGSVSFNFERRARLDIAPASTTTTSTSGILDDESLLELCISCGIDDFESYFQTQVSEDGLISDPRWPRRDGEVTVFVQPTDMAALKKGLVGGGEYRVMASIQNIPTATVAISDVDFETNMAAIDALMMLDDVDSVEHNILMDSQE